MSSEAKKNNSGANTMSSPSNPSHPNQQVAGFDPSRAGPYVQFNPIPPSKSPMDNILGSLNKWAKQLEMMVENVWNHLTLGPSTTDTAWGKISSGFKVISEGGYENVFKQNFGAEPYERLRKTYACFLSTSTGPVSGVIYISTHRFAFCSDRPLAYSPITGQQALSFYKLVIRIDKVKTVNPVHEHKYVQIVTDDEHQFWFMGFVHYDKAVRNLQAAVYNRHDVHM